MSSIQGDLFLLIYHFWMRTWELNDLEGWPRIGLAAQAADLTVTYLVAVLLFPRENDTTDLRAGDDRLRGVGVPGGAIDPSRAEPETLGSWCTPGVGVRVLVGFQF